MEDVCVEIANNVMKDNPNNTQTTLFSVATNEGDWDGYVYFYDSNYSKVEINIRFHSKCNKLKNFMMYRKNQGGYAEVRKEYKNSGWTIKSF